MRLYALAAFAAVSAAAPAAAEVVVLTATTVPNGQTNSSTVSFAQFDPSLGVLESVTLAFEAASSTTVDVSNSSNMSRNYNVTGNASASLTGNGFTLTDSYVLSGDTFTLGARFSPSNPRTTTRTYTADLSDSNIVTTNLAAFAGPGTVSFNFARAANFTGSPGNVSARPTSFSGNATLTYTFSTPTAVPEPATWALMLGGFGVVGAASRRRKRAEVTYA
jgi:hypothetical protein